MTRASLAFPPDGSESAATHKNMSKFSVIMLTTLLFSLAALVVKTQTSLVLTRWQVFSAIAPRVALELSLCL